VGEAYATYQTHAAPEDQFARHGTWLGRLRRAARNGYANARYGYHAQPASYVGAAAIALVPKQRLAVDRWLMRFPRKAGGRLLDVGCGAGGFLKQMQQLGWTVQGVDFDAQAVATARALGLDVRLGGIEAAEGSFDAIALNHVIEHVHDPLALLQACAQALNTTGALWVATPNLQSFGHSRYGRFWRGLEAPRHLQLFTAASLGSLLLRAGLMARGPLRTRAWASEHFAASEALQGSRHALTALAAIAADTTALVAPALGEELVFVCTRSTRAGQSDTSAR
jgi:2-polyprenyl-3-methyl-5-hydroxy-6-metoxy-1,4-benzoquinol methylase